MTIQALPSDTVMPAGPILQRPVRALLSGVGIWLVGALLTIIGTRGLPADAGASTTYLTFSWMVLATVVVLLSVSYLRRVDTSSRTEGVLVGVVWVATFVALDLVHFAFMHPAALGGYAAAHLPTYLPVPVMTTLVLGWLRGR